MVRDDALVIVLAGGAGERLSPLTRDRAKPAVYFGGPYRIIDFVLSNSVNSGLRRIFIATQYKSLSLNRHIRMGWTIVSEELGEFIEILPPQKRVGEHWYLGTADAVYQNLYSIEDEAPRHVVVLAGDHVYKMDYRRMLRSHEETGAAVTLATIEVPVADGDRFGIVAVDESGKVVGFDEKPRSPVPIPGQPHLALASMGVYVFNMDVLHQALELDAADPASHHDFGKNIIPALIPTGQVYAYAFYDENKKGAKYWRDIGTLDAYYEANMDLCHVNPEFNLYDPEWPMRTHQPQAPPAKFVFADARPHRHGARLGDLARVHRLGQPDQGQHPVPQRPRPQLRDGRRLHPDARRAGGPPRAHPERDHRPRRARAARRRHRLRRSLRPRAAHRDRARHRRRHRRRGAAGGADWRRRPGVGNRRRPQVRASAAAGCAPSRAAAWARGAASGRRSAARIS